MSDASTQSLPLLSPPTVRGKGWVWALSLLVLAALLGAAIGYQPLVAILAAALACVVLAIPFVEPLAVATFWLLPYLIFNVSAGGATWKAPEMTAYLFATAALARALLRKERILLPPATPQVLIYLGVLAISAAVAPIVPTGMVKDSFSGLQGPMLRPAATIFWLALSWLVVVGLHHVVGTSASLYRRCLCAHVVSGGIASLLGIVGYAMALRGYDRVLQAIGHGHHFIFTGGSVYRLTGVSYEPLLFAFYLVTVIPVTGVIALKRPDWLPRRVSVPILITQGVAMLLTFSAGGWVAIAFGLAVMGWIFRPKQINWKKAAQSVAAAFALLGLLGVLCLNIPPVNRTMVNAISKISHGGYQMRHDENLTGMRIFESHFWLGVGPGMTTFHFLKYHPHAYTIVETGGSIYVNNLYITTLAETGVIGFAALLLCGVAGSVALGAVILHHGSSRVPCLTALSVSLVGCAIQYYETQNLFLIYFPALIGLAVAGARLANSGVEAESISVEGAP